jgi:hypothetical protein
MPELADPPAPTTEIVTVERQRKGVAVSEELIVRYQAAFGPLPATLSIGSEWNGSTWKRWREYEVAEVPCELGRAFHLTREPAAVEKDPQHVPSYWVLTGADQRCDCRGMAGTERAGRVCCHLAAMSRLVSIEAV